MVCVGRVGRETARDDAACAECLAEAIGGSFPPIGPIRERLRAGPGGAKFFYPARPQFPRQDFDLCARPSGLPVVPRPDSAAGVTARVAVRASGECLGKPG